MMKRVMPLVAVFTLFGAGPALAHLDPVGHGSFMAGFSHPLFGADHVLAMVAVGLWAALLGGRPVWLVPAAFVGTMLAGFLVAMSGTPLPFVEPVILASAVVIGLLAAVALNVPAAAAMALVSAFALFHGNAHGGEMGQAAAGGYAAGFAIATALLHASGIFLGTGLDRLLGAGFGRNIARAAGAITALGGFWLVMAS